MAIYGDGKHNENMEHVTKEQYDFYLDRKVTIWVREQHSIEAESEEAAKKEMIERFKDNLCSESFDSQEWLYDTETFMEPGDNGGESTAELFFEDTNELLTTNID
jgi:hypothetical protein